MSLSLKSTAARRGITGAKVEHHRIMSKVVWVLGGGRHATEAEFSEAVRAYHVDIMGDAERWRPDEVVLEVNELEVLYDYWEIEPKEREVMAALRLRSRSGEGFRAADLLYQINEAVNDQLAPLDHKFFEGLTFSEHGPGGVPRYWMNLGS